MSGVTYLDTDYSDFLEFDPTRRYGRYNEILGKGASKTVYRGFDEYDGVEVAWNQVKIYDCMKSSEDLDRLYYEIHLLKTLKHSNIMKFYTSWVDSANRNINFVTEMFTSGTLRQYRLKHRKVSIRALKNWCRQILKGLLYLHSQDPPVIHRDIKCDNIFVNGNQGEVKIGDLGLAAILRNSHVAHCVGTPEFMAPEVYEEEYNELVDIYSFGMCILEMVTFEYPYSECTHPAQIYKKVISGKKPESYYKVHDPEVQKFVEKCLATVSFRLSAWELLNDPFLRIDNHRRELTLYNDHFSNISMINGYDNFPGFDFDHENFENVEISIRGKIREDNGIFLRLRIADKDGQIRNIYFPFDIKTDTAMSVAKEMVSELDMTGQDVTKIADMIESEISTLVPNWKTNETHEQNLCQNCASNGSFTNYLGSKNLQVLECSNHGCAAMHGRFEEITYQVDDSSEQWNTDGAPGCSSESESSHFADIWAQRDQHSDQEHQEIEKQELETGFSIHDDYENEIRQELRWLKAKYQMQLRDSKDTRLASRTDSEPVIFLHKATSLPVDAVKY